MKKLQQFVTGRRWPGSRRRRALVAGIVAMALVVSGGLVAMAVTIPPANAGGLVEAGPISGENGFPVWYKDSGGVRLEACLDDADPFCGFLAGDVPDPTKPISFPDNFPEEFFYQRADNVQDVRGGAGRATTVMAVEGRSPTRSRTATRSSSRGSASSTAGSSRTRPTASPTPSASTRKLPTPTGRSASPRTSASPRAASPARSTAASGRS
jgi:hypothetical protein